MPAEFDALDELKCRRSLQRPPIKHPRTIRQRVFRFDLTTCYRLAQGTGANVEERGGLCLVHPAFGRTTILVEAGNLVVTSKRSNPLARPAVTATSRQPASVQGASDQVIGTDLGEGTYCLDDFRRGMPVALAASSTWETQLTMNAAPPMNQQHNFRGSLVDIDD